MKRAMLPLNALRAFEAAARHLSFKNAANELSVTPAAVSQLIRSLEATLGVKLFKRSARALSLTPVAKKALQNLEGGFEQLELAVNILQDTETDPILRVATSPSFASKWLVPRIASFYNEHHDATVKVSSGMALTDFKNDEVDIAIRYGGGNYKGVFVEELLRETVFPVCAPSLLEEKTISRPEDLSHVTIIHDDSFSDDMSAPSWAMWLKAAGINQLDGQRALHFDHHGLAIEAAVAGRGVVMARSAIAEEDLKAGRLVRLFDQAVSIDFAHFIVCPEDKVKEEKIKVFIDWLRREVKK